MVFESVVVDLLNRFLGDYVENLDRSQLQIGIWGGDVVLNNLELKQTALNDLDLPVQTVYGHLGKLVLKIPWKNLYGAPVEACIERLYLLAAPNQEVDYDPEKEDRKNLDAKRKELLRIEEAKKKEAEKDLPKPDDTFIEKLATQIIKNVQLKIRDIHIRYEDKITNPKHPFSLGITLSNLCVETTDEHWKKNIISDALSKIYKIVELEGLGVYWNCDSPLFSTMSQPVMMEHFASGIANREIIPVGFHYLLGPINSTAQLRLNPKPEQDKPAFTSPKIILNLDMEKLSVELTRAQYQDLIRLAESMDRMNKGKPYRKYRPFLTTYRGYYKQWWKFAYNCILNEEVKRKRNNWDWEHMHKHRQRCKDYASAYYEKLRSKKLSNEALCTLDLCERNLDLRNLVIIRQKIDLEVAIENEKKLKQNGDKSKVSRIEKTTSKGTKQGKSWFGGWWGGASNEDKEIASTVNIMKKFEDAMTPEEKNKLYRAIDYQENSAPATLPIEFVEMNVSFILNKLEIKIRDDRKNCVLYTELNRVECKMDQRPAASAMKVELKIKSFSIFGLEQGEYKPQLVTSKEFSDTTHLLDVLFETNPLDKMCDQRIHITSKPLQILYDGQTINKIIEVFKPPSDTASITDQIQHAASTRLANIKEMSATGIQYAVQKQAYMEIKIDVLAPYVIVPYKGVFSGSESLLLIDFGRLQVNTRPRSTDNVKNLHQQGLSEEDIIKEMIKQSYDIFEIKIIDMKVLFALKYEDWYSTLNNDVVTPLHLLQPTSLIVGIHKCLIEDDPRLPKIKVVGQLASICINFSDVRLIELLSLVKSLPILNSTEMATPVAESHLRASSLSLLKYLTTPEAKTEKSKASDKMLDQLVHMTDLTVDFEMKEMVVTIYNKLAPKISKTDLFVLGADVDPAIYEDKLISFHILALELNVVQHPYDMIVGVKLGGVALNQYNSSGVLNIINTPMTSGKSEYLFSVEYINVDRKSPAFQTKHLCVEQLINLHFTTLQVLLHQEALVELLQIVNNMQKRLDELAVENQTDRVASIGTIRDPLPTIVEEGSVVSHKTQQPRIQKKRVDKILLKINAKLDAVRVDLANSHRELASLSVEGLNVGVMMKESYTQVSVKLNDITVLDKNKLAHHTKILRVVDDQALACSLVMYNLEHTSDFNQNDISVDVNMGCVKIIFLNWFVSSILNFLNNFQSAQQAIINSASAAAEEAMQNMKIVAQKATRIELKVKLKAPIVVVPINSKSFDALIIDFGLISINNRFITLDVKNESNNSAVVDEMKLQLENLKISRVKLNASYEIDAENKLLKPTSFVLLVKRNLSSSWFNTIPDIEMSGRIKSIELLLSQDDFKMIMQTLSENLSEGQNERPLHVSPQPSQQIEVDEWKDTKASPSSGQPIVEVYSSTNTEDVEKETHATQLLNKVNTFVSFSFTMDSLIIDLFTGKTNSPIESPSRETENGLARFSLLVLSLKGSLYSDGSLTTSILLIDCLLDDTRPGREHKLKRYIERRGDTTIASPNIDNSGGRSMIDITYRTKGQDMFADVRVFSFNLICSVDYLMTVAAFFTSAADTPADKPALTDNTSSKSIKSKQSHSSSKTTKVSQPKGENSAMMTVNLRIEKPDIILVERMDDLNCNAIILNSEIVFQLRMTGDHQVLSGAIKDCNLYTCTYNPELRHRTKYNVLKPCTISIAGSTPENKGLHIDLCVSDIGLSVSPATIEMLTKILATMTAKEVTDHEEEIEPIDYSTNWETQEFNEEDYWFLKTEEAEDALSIMEQSTKVLEELCMVSMPSIVLTIEAGVGTKTLPMILLETTFTGVVNNWSSKLSVESSLRLQMSYYNSTIALWEPFIEPVEYYHENQVSYKPWELNLEVQMNSEENLDAEETPPPAMSISISSRQNLELTFTKTSLDVLSNLGKAFGAALKPGDSKEIVANAPYEIRNDTGLDITLLLNKGPFCAYGNTGYDVIMLGTGAKAGLQLRHEENLQVMNMRTSTSSTSLQTIEKYINAKIMDINCELAFPISRADSRFFPLYGVEKSQYRGESGDKWGVISEVHVEDGGTIVTIRSIVQVNNHLSCPVNVYYMTKQGNEVDLVGKVEPNGHLNLPLSSVYTQTSEIFFSIPGYSLSIMPFIWKELQSTVSLTKLLRCDYKNAVEKDSFFIQAIGELKQVYYENTSRHTMASTSYNIRLRPAVILYNCLPLEIVVCVGADEKIVKAGDSLQMPNIEPGQSSIVIRLSKYLEKEWACRHEILSAPSEFTVWSFESHDSAQKVVLDLGMHTVDKFGSMVMSLYCPFWMLNKTGLMLSYRKSRKTEKNELSETPNKNSDETNNILYHPEHFKGPLLFSFRAKNFFGKKKAAIRVDDGEWSDKFSLDVVGSSGVIVCKAKDRIFQIGVANQLTYNSLSKQVMFTPYYVLINEAAVFFECQEADRPSDPWIKVEAGECLALWPRSEKEDKLLRIKCGGEPEITPPFIYTNVQTTLLKLQNKFGGANVEVQVTEGSVYVTLRTYYPGMAPALLVNFTNDVICFWEKESVNVRKLDPYNRMFYTWENPAGPRVILFDGGDKQEIENGLRKDDMGVIKMPGDREIYWVSFLDGMQRILLFTGEKDKAFAALSSGNLEKLDQEINVSIHGVGLSIVNNLTLQEIMYIGIASSGVIWEVSKSNSNRFKQLSIVECAMIEDAYQTYQAQCQVYGNSRSARVVIDPKTEVDFENNVMLRPHHRTLRRTFHNGVWLQLKTSEFQVQLHAKLNRLQIDNQMYDCVFPVILAPVPPPKSLADVVLKPFAELSIVEKKLKHSSMKQFKYFTLLIQEFHIKLDLGFINAIVNMFQPDEMSDKEAAEFFAKDLTLVDESLMSLVATQSLQEQKSFYDNLHFSPLKIHISFSMSGSGGGSPGALPHFLSVLLQGIGVTLTDLHDVVFRLAYFQREYVFLSQKQLISEASTHYAGQAVKQLYVLVLGLDVIGNPFGLVVGITKGVEDLFYEPFQGAIQGPGEFAEGLVLGMRSLFGHTVGGAAGAVSRITGAMGKGLAALTFDKEYQRKRNDQLNKRPANLQEGLARSGKGLVMGVVDGVTGVFTKPISGAKQQGVEGFFKGLGKGAVGLVTRPTAGIVDFASGSFDAVKRATDMGDEINRLRAPRFLHPDNLVRPYHRLEAEGNKLLMDLEKGKFANTDVYSYHLNIIQNKDILLLTDKRVFYLVKNDIFGGWQVEWAYTWHDIKKPITVNERGVLISVSETKKKVLGLFSSHESNKLIFVSPDSRDDLSIRMEELRKSV